MVLVERQSNINPLAWLILFLLLSLLTIAFVVRTEKSHAVKHGSEALAVRLCLDHGGADLVFRKGDRTAELCKINDRWGIRITDDDVGEVTAYIRRAKGETVEKIKMLFELKGYK